MKNQPERIFLTLGLAETKDVDFNELTQITWCRDRIFENDLPYYSRNFLINLFTARIEEINQEIKTVNEATMSGGKKANRLRGIKKELKQWMTIL